MLGDDSSSVDCSGDKGGAEGLLSTELEGGEGVLASAFPTDLEVRGVIGVEVRGPVMMPCDFF